MKAGTWSMSLASGTFHAGPYAKLTSVSEALSLWSLDFDCICAFT